MLSDVSGLYEVTSNYCFSDDCTAMPTYRQANGTLSLIFVNSQWNIVDRLDEQNCDYNDYYYMYGYYSGSAYDVSFDESDWYYYNGDALSDICDFSIECVGET